MKPKFFLTLLFFIPILSYAQEKGQSKILVTLSDGVAIQDKVKNVLLQNKFTIELDQKNVLVSYPKELDKVLGYVIAKAEIKGNVIEFTGSYTLSKTDGLGNVYIPNDFEKLTYTKGNHAWRMLSEVAAQLNGSIAYSR